MRAVVNVVVETANGINRDGTYFFKLAGGSVPNKQHTRKAVHSGVVGQPSWQHTFLVSADQGEQVHLELWRKKKIALLGINTGKREFCGATADLLQIRGQYDGQMPLDHPCVSAPGAALRDVGTGAAVSVHVETVWIQPGQPLMHRVPEDMIVMVDPDPWLNRVELQGEIPFHILASVIAGLPSSYVASPLVSKGGEPIGLAFRLPGTSLKQMGGFQTIGGALGRQNRMQNFGITIVDALSRVGFRIAGLHGDTLLLQGGTTPHSTMIGELAVTAFSLIPPRLDIALELHGANDQRLVPAISPIFGQHQRKSDAHGLQWDRWPLPQNMFTLNMADQRSKVNQMQNLFLVFLDTMGQLSYTYITNWGSGSLFAMLPNTPPAQRQHLLVDCSVQFSMQGLDFYCELQGDPEFAQQLQAFATALGLGSPQEVMGLQHAYRWKIPQGTFKWVQSFYGRKKAEQHVQNFQLRVLDLMSRFNYTHLNDFGQTNIFFRSDQPVPETFHTLIECMYYPPNMSMQGVMRRGLFIEMQGTVPPEVLQELQGVFQCNVENNGSYYALQTPCPVFALTIQTLKKIENRAQNALLATYNVFARHGFRLKAVLASPFAAQQAQAQTDGTQNRQSVMLEVPPALFTWCPSAPAPPPLEYMMIQASAWFQWIELQGPLQNVDLESIGQSCTPAERLEHVDDPKGGSMHVVRMPSHLFKYKLTGNLLLNPAQIKETESACQNSLLRVLSALHRTGWSIEQRADVLIGVVLSRPAGAARAAPVRVQQAAPIIKFEKPQQAVPQKWESRAPSPRGTRRKNWMQRGPVGLEPLQQQQQPSPPPSFEQPMYQQPPPQQPSPPPSFQQQPPQPMYQQQPQQQQQVMFRTPPPPPHKRQQYHALGASPPAGGHGSGDAPKRPLPPPPGSHF